MPQENVEAYERAIATFNSRDLEAHLEMLDPEHEFHSVFAEMLEGDGIVYRGHEGVVTQWADLDEVFDEFYVEVSEIRDLGDRILVISRLHAIGTTSGVEVEAAAAWLVDFRNGKVLRVLTYLDPDDALAAAGLSE